MTSGTAYGGLRVLDTGSRSKDAHDSLNVSAGAVPVSRDKLFLVFTDASGPCHVL